jgi:hypothetical protein
MTIESVSNGFVVEADGDRQARLVVEIRDGGPAEDFQKRQAEALAALAREVLEWARFTDGPDILSKHAGPWAVEVALKRRRE